MIPVTQSQTGAGSTNGIITDHFVTPFNCGIGVVVSGTVNYTVQHTFDGTNWFNHPTLVGQTANMDGNYAFPVLQVRLTVNSGTGTATITQIQAGLTR